MTNKKKLSGLEGMHVGVTIVMVVITGSSKIDQWRLEVGAIGWQERNAKLGYIWAKEMTQWLQNEYENISNYV